MSQHRPRGLRMIVLLVLSTCLLAFAPTQKQLPTIFEEVLPYRTSIPNTPEWQVFQSHHGNGWQLSIDPVSGIPHRIWGRSISIEGSVSESNIRVKAMDFIRDYAHIMQINPDDFIFERAEQEGRIWYVSFHQIYGGVPVFRSRLELRIDESGKVMLFGSSYKPGIDISLQPVYSSLSALDVAISDLGSPSTGVTEQEGIVVYSIPREKEYSYHLGYLIRIETTDIPGWWEYVIDAHDGSILHRINNLPTVHYEGTVSGPVKPFYSDDSDVIMNFFDERVYIDGSAVYTDESGLWSVDISSGTHTFETDLYGPWVNVNNEDYADANFTGSFSSSPYNFTWTTDEAYIDESTVFYQVNFIHDFWKNTMGYDGMDYRMPANVKVGDSYDNAYYSGADGSINFGSGGSYFYNLALHADVVYHEYVHGVTHHIYPGGMLPYTGQSGALDEAFSDYFPCSITDESEMGERLYRSSRSLSMRNCDNTNRYPDDYTDEVHHDAMIVTGALWEIRADIGADLTNEITHYARFGYPENYEDLLTEILIADDDDGDLGNGTPHAATIYEAFHNHGIGPGIELTLEHYPVPDAESSYMTHLAYVDVTSTVNVNLDESFLSYSTTGGSSWTEIPLLPTPTADRYMAEIPAQPMETDVLYYIEVKNVGDQIATHPEAGSIAPHMFHIGLDEQAPIITHAEMPDQSYIVWPALMQCDITDNLGISEVWCELRVNSTDVDPVVFEETETRDRWRGIIDCDVSVGDIISYKIVAVDGSMAGNTATLPETGWYSFEVVDYYFEPFEYEYMPYTHERITEGYGDQWNVVDYRNHTTDGGKSFKCGDTSFDLVYMDLVDGALVSPVFNLGENSTLSFWQFIYTEVSGYYTGYAYDGGIVEARSAGGSWVQIYPVGGYPMLYRNTSETGAFPHDTPCFGGELMWHEVEFDLSAFTGSTQIRWRFGSDRAIAYEGWYIDDVTIETEFMDLSDDTQMPESFGLAAYPNPFNAACNIALTPDIEYLEIVDIEGRSVLRLKVSDLAAFIWEPAGLPSGIYTARLIGQKGQESMKLLYLK